MNREDSQLPSGVRFQVLTYVCILSMITYLDRAAMASAAPALAHELSLSGVEQLKWAFTSFAIGYAIFEIPTGWLADRWGPRGVLIRIVAWWSVCTTLTGLVGMKVGGAALGGLATLIVLRFLFGAGEAGAYPNITRVVHNWIPSTQWAMAQGYVFMAARLAGGFTPLIWTVLVSGTQYSPALMTWRGAFFIFGVLGLLWCALFAIQFHNRPEDHPKVNPAELELIKSGQERITEPAHGAIPWRSFLKNRNLWVLCLMYVCLGYGWFFNISYLPTYMKNRYDLGDDSIVGAIYKGGPLWVGAAGCLLGGILAGRLSQRLGSRRAGRRMLGVAAMCLASACWLAAINAPTPLIFFLIVSTAAFCNDLTIGPTWATCQDVGQRFAAVTAAWMNTVGTVGGALTAYLTGSIVSWAVDARASALGLPVTALPFAERQAASEVGYQNVFISYAAAYIVAAACWLVIDPNKPVVGETRDRVDTV